MLSRHSPVSGVNEGMPMAERGVTPSDLVLPPTQPIDMTALIAAALSGDQEI